MDFNIGVERKEDSSFSLSLSLEEIFIRRYGTGRIISNVQQNSLGCGAHLHGRSGRDVIAAALLLALQGAATAHRSGYCCWWTADAALQDGPRSVAGRRWRLQEYGLAVGLSRRVTAHDAAVGRQNAVRHVADGALHGAALLGKLLPPPVAAVVEAGEREHIEDEQGTADGDGDAQGRRVHGRVAAADSRCHVAGLGGQRRRSVARRRRIGSRWRSGWSVRLRDDARDLLGAGRRPLFSHVDVRTVDPGGQRRRRSRSVRLESFGRQNPVPLLHVVLACPLQFGQQLQQDSHAVSPVLAFHFGFGSCCWTSTRDER